MLLAVAVLLFDAPAVSAQGCAPLPAGAVAWWPGEGDATDIVGGFHGTLTENVQFAPGMVGQAFSLDGNASYVQVPDDPALDPVDAASLETWVWFNQVPSAARRIMTIIGKSGWGRDLDLLGHVDDHFYFYIANGIHVRSTTQIQPNRWYHVVGTYVAGTGLDLYVNGVNEATLSAAVFRGPNLNPVGIGESLFFRGRYFNGLID